MIEARLAGKKPIAVLHCAETDVSAVHGATHKMLHRLDDCQPFDHLCIVLPYVATIDF